MSAINKPRISEKAYNSANNDNVYVFEVDKSANSLEIKHAIEERYKVNVLDVRTTNLKGKPKKAIKKRQRPGLGFRVDIKKAYVVLDKKDKINLFGEDDSKKTNKTTDKSPKADEIQKDDKSAKKSGLRRAFSRNQRQTQDRGGGK